MNEQQEQEGVVEVVAGEPLYVHLALTDPQVVASVQERQSGADRNAFLELAIKIGIMSMQAAKGVVDGAAIRESGDKLIAQMAERLQGHRDMMDQLLAGTLRQYFDPDSGQFAQRVQALTRDEGELARVIARQVDGHAGKLREMLDGYVGEKGELRRLLAPGQENGFVSDMQRRMEQVVEAQRQAIVAQFTLDNEASAMSRLVKELKANHGDVAQALSLRIESVVREFSLDEEGSALSRLVRRVEEAHTSITKEFSLDHNDSALKRFMDQIDGKLNEGQKQQVEFQGQVLAMLAGLSAQKKAEARSTTHGMVFEESVIGMLEDICSPAGEVVEATGSTTGLVRACKVGDAVITVGPESVASGARIVVEAKEAGNYTLASTLAECDEARRNRGAQVCVFVHSAKSAPKGMDELKRFGTDIVVVWDAEDPMTDVRVKAALTLAKYMCSKAAAMSSKEAASWTAIDKAVETIGKASSNFGELKTTAETIQRAADRQLERIRIMSTQIEDALAALKELLAGVRETA